MDRDVGVGHSETWRDEAVGAVKLAVPMTTGDAHRVVDAVLDVMARALLETPTFADRLDLLEALPDD